MVGSTIKLLKVLYGISVVSFLVLQLGTYALLPRMVASHFGLTMVANCYVPKADYFKTLLSLFIFMNLIFLVMIAVFPRMPSNLINTPNRQFWMNLGNKPVFVNILVSRLYGMLVLVNLLFTVLSYYVFKANLSSPVALSSDIYVVLIFFFVIVLMGTIQLVVRLSRVR
jgi:uncharacterized membrane protein